MHYHYHYHYHYRYRYRYRYRYCVQSQESLKHVPLILDSFTASPRIIMPYLHGITLGKIGQHGVKLGNMG